MGETGISICAKSVFTFVLFFHNVLQHYFELLIPLSSLSLIHQGSTMFLRKMRDVDDEYNSSIAAGLAFAAYECVLQKHLQSLFIIYSTHCQQSGFNFQYFYSCFKI